MLAAELARLLGADLGVESAGQILEEIVSVAPSHVGLTVDAIHGARDGVVVGRPARPGRPRRRPRGHAPRPGRAVARARRRRRSRRGERRRRRMRRTPQEEQQAAEAEATEAQAAAPRRRDPARPARRRRAPPVLAFNAPATADPPAVDAYSLRLVASRRLYDLGTDAQHSPGLAGLTSDTVLRLHPHDFDRLGVSAGGVVTATSSKGSVSLARAARRTASVGVRPSVTSASPAPRVGALIDATAPVTEIRVVKA